MRGIALCGAAIGLAGCSLLFSTSDLVETERPPDAASSVDAPGDGPPPIVAEAGAETGAPDAAPDAGPFCKALSPAPDHCADFEDGAVLAFFDEAFRDPVGPTTAIAAEDGAARIAIADAGDCSYARLVKTIPRSASGMKVRFKVRPSAPWPKDQIFFNLQLGTQLGCALLFHLEGNGAAAQLHVQYGFPEQNDGYAWAVPPKVGEWSDVEVELAAADPPTVTIKTNGLPAIQNKVLSQCSFASEAWLALGFHCSSGTAELRYDDVVVDYP